VEKGGKIIVMGDGMVSLYMTSWEGVQDYQCQEFVQVGVPVVAEVMGAIAGDAAISATARRRRSPGS
jgi:hypothetical protein